MRVAASNVYLRSNAGVPKSREKRGLVLVCIGADFCESNYQQIFSVQQDLRKSAPLQIQIVGKVSFHNDFGKIPVRCCKVLPRFENSARI